MEQDVNVMGKPIRQKRRMAGIPPLAEDLIIAVRQPAATAPAGATDAAELRSIAETSAPAEAVVSTPVPPVAVAVRRTGRRMGGPSNAPLLVATPQGTSRPQQDTKVVSVSATQVDAPAAEQHTQVTPVQPQVAETRRKGRRMTGASTVPLRISAPVPTTATPTLTAVESQTAVSTTTETTEVAPESLSRLETDTATKAAPAAQSAAAPEQGRSAQAQRLAGEKLQQQDTTKKELSRTAKLAIQVGSVLLVAIVVVLAAKWLRTLAPVQDFISQFPGSASQPQSAPTGVPTWMSWQHFLNMFFMVLIVRSGLQVRLQQRPPGYWKAKQKSFFSPGAQTPKKISLTQWFHQFLDVFWVVNGVLFVIALLVTGYWMRIVPTSWDIFPNMVSVGVQYASLDWPEENGWIHYNAMQVMAYFITVFIAAPLAIISGLRMSTWWPSNAAKLSKIYPIEVARAIHIPVMIYFLAFTVVHVFLVFFTGARRNLNHMFTARDVVDLWGLAIFALSVLVIAAAWFLTSPLFLRPLAGAMGKVSKN